MRDSVLIGLQLNVAKEMMHDRDKDMMHDNDKGNGLLVRFQSCVNVCVLKFAASKTKKNKITQRCFDAFGHNLCGPDPVFNASPLALWVEVLLQRQSSTGECIYRMSSIVDLYDFLP